MIPYTDGPMGPGQIWLPEAVTFPLENIIPPKFQQANLHKDANADPVADMCRAYVSEFTQQENGVLFAGHTGFGKTHYACAIVNEVFRCWAHEIPITAYYFNMNTDLPELLDKKSMKRYDSYISDWQKLTQSTILIVDDLLHVNNQEWAKEVLYRIYEARYSSGLRTITTLNANISTGDDGTLDWSPISDVFNDAFMRRVVESAGNNLVLV